MTVTQKSCGQGGVIVNLPKNFGLTDQAIADMEKRLKSFAAGAATLLGASDPDETFSIEMATYGTMVHQDDVSKRMREAGLPEEDLVGKTISFTLIAENVFRLPVVSQITRVEVFRPCTIWIFFNPFNAEGRTVQSLCAHKWRKEELISKSR